MEKNTFNIRVIGALLLALYYLSHLIIVNSQLFIIPLLKTTVLIALLTYSIILAKKDDKKSDFIVMFFMLLFAIDIIQNNGAIFTMPLKTIAYGLLGLSLVLKEFKSSKNETLDTFENKKYCESEIEINLLLAWGKRIMFIGYLFLVPFLLLGTAIIIFYYSGPVEVVFLITVLTSDLVLGFSAYLVYSNKKFGEILILTNLFVFIYMFIFKYNESLFTEVPYLMIGIIVLMFGAALSLSGKIVNLYNSKNKLSL